MTTEKATTNEATASAVPSLSESDSASSLNLRSSVSTWQAGLYESKPVESDHEYLRKFVDPILMPLIESLLLHQPHSIYEYIHEYVSEQEDKKPSSRPNSGGSDGSSSSSSSLRNKKLVNRRKMVDFMSSSVIPVMDELARKILREKPSSVRDFIKETVGARLLLGRSGGNLTAEEECEQLSNEKNPLQVNDQILCRYKGRPRFLNATIIGINNDDEPPTYNVRYEDGKTENNVHRMCIKRPGSNSASNSSNNLHGSSSTDKLTNQNDDNNNQQASPRTDTPSNGGDENNSYYADLTEKMVILMLGIDGAGKSTLLSTLQGDLEKDHVPSAGFTSASFQINEKGGNAVFYDLGGGPAFRNVWKEYFADAHGLIFVMDGSAEEKQLDESLTALQSTLNDPLMNSKPLLLFANKNDKPWKYNADELEAKALAPHKSKRSTKFIPCAAKVSSTSNSNVDERLEKGLGWLFNQVGQHFTELNEKVQKDLQEKKKADQLRKDEQRKRVTKWKEERELKEMQNHDKAIHRAQDSDSASSTAVSAASTSTTASASSSNQSQGDNEIKCSNCNIKPAETKCAASKWMPVCQGCASELKQKAQAEAQQQENVIKCTNCTVKPAETKCAASKWMPVCGTCATELKQKAQASTQ